MRSRWFTVARGRADEPCLEELLGALDELRGCRVHSCCVFPVGVGLRPNDYARHPGNVIGRKVIVRIRIRAILNLLLVY